MPASRKPPVPGLDLSDALVVSMRIASSPPSACTLGSVVVSDALVDWDRKYRLTERDGEVERTFVLFAYRPHDYIHRLDPDLVSAALATAYEAGPYVASAMEDDGTATALDCLDDYPSGREIMNFDRSAHRDSSRP